MSAQLLKYDNNYYTLNSCSTQYMVIETSCSAKLIKTITSPNFHPYQHSPMHALLTR